MRYIHTKQIRHLRIEYCWSCGSKQASEMSIGDSIYGSCNFIHNCLKIRLQQNVGILSWDKQADKKRVGPLGFCVPWFSTLTSTSVNEVSADKIKATLTTKRSPHLQIPSARASNRRWMVATCFTIALSWTQCTNSSRCSGSRGSLNFLTRLSGCVGSFSLSSCTWQTR